MRTTAASPDWDQNQIKGGRQTLQRPVESAGQLSDTAALPEAGNLGARLGRLLWGNRTVLLASLIALVVYLFTLQLEVNGNHHPYKMDVGEIQNALPRWGTLHAPGYPLYALLGSAFVTALQLLGIPPAAGASLFSALWAAVAVGLLVRLALELEVRSVAAMFAALLFGLSSSMWVDASIAEVHTMTMALTLAALLAAVRFGRTGQAGALYWLAFLAGQGLAHQRAFGFLSLGLLVLVLPQWRAVWRRLPIVISLGLSGLLAYLYIPLQAWAGVTWLFEPFTWQTLLHTITDTKAERIVTLPQSMAELWMRLTGVTQLLADDWPLLLLLAGLAGLLLLRPRANRLERWGLTLSWLPYLLMSFIIWEGQVSDALLAVKMPVLALAGLGLALLTHRVWQWRPIWGKGLVVAWLLTVMLLYLNHRPTVLSLTRDGGGRKRIALVSRLTPDPDGRPTTFVAFWGDAYWQLAYAQGFEGQVPDLHLTDHTQDLGAVLGRGHRLVAYSQSFRTMSIHWWEQYCIGPTIHLSSLAPGIVEIRMEPQIEAIGPATAYLHVFDKRLAIREVTVSPVGTDTVQVAIAWQALHNGLDDYGAAVQIIARDPQTGQEEIGSQVTQAHLVAGAYPTSRLVKGEVIWDYVELDTVDGAQWLCIRTLTERQGRLYYREPNGFMLPLRAGRVIAWSSNADVEGNAPVTEGKGER